MRRTINITFDISEREYQLLCWGQADQPDPLRVKTMLLRDAAKCVRFEIDHTLRLHDEACCPPPIKDLPPPHREPRTKREKLAVRNRRDGKLTLSDAIAMARIAIAPGLPEHLPCDEPTCSICH